MSSAVFSLTTPSLGTDTMSPVRSSQTLTVIHVSTTLVAQQHWRKPDQDCGSQLVTFDIGPIWVSNLCTRSPYSRPLTTFTRAATTTLHPLTPAAPISNPDNGDKDCSNWLTIGLPIVLVAALLLALWYRQSAARRQNRGRPSEEHEMVNPYINVPPQGTNGYGAPGKPDVKPAQKVADVVFHPDMAAGNESPKKKTPKKTPVKKTTSSPPLSKSLSSKNSSSEDTSYKDSSTTASNSNAERRRQAQNAARQNPISKAIRRRGQSTIRHVASDLPSFPPRAARRNATVVDEGSVSPRGTFSTQSARRNAMSDEPQSPRGTDGIEWNTNIFGN